MSFIKNKERYHIPNIYSASHYLMGTISAFIPTLVVPFYFYQIGQLLCNRRVFLLHRKVEKGNHLPHTLRKMSQFLFGMIVGTVVINQVKPKL